MDICSKTDSRCVLEGRSTTKSQLSFVLLPRVAETGAHCSLEL